MTTPISATPVAARFAAPELIRLGPPPTIASQPFETLNTAAKNKLVADMAAIGIAYDTATIQYEPAIVLTQDAAYRDMLRRQEIDDAVAQTYLNYATGTLLDARAADYLILRRTVAPANPSVVTEPLPRPTTVPTAWTWVPAVNGAGANWKEDDASLRNRALLSWEALSVAGPPGAYVFHALDAHPQVQDAVVYGPESDALLGTGVQPGQVLLVIQSFNNAGIPNFDILNAVAARLDAYQITDALGVVTTRAVRDAQSVRPIGADVFVRSCLPLSFYVDATIYVPPGNDPEQMRLTAIARLNAYLAKRNRIGMAVTLSGMETALSIADADGLPTVDEVIINHPTTDVQPTFVQLATSASVTVKAIIR